MLLLDALHRWPRNWFLDGTFAAFSEYDRNVEKSAKKSVCSGNSAFTVGAAAMTAAGAVAASTRRKGRTSKAGTFSGRGLQASRHMGLISCHRLLPVQKWPLVRRWLALTLAPLTLLWLPWRFWSLLDMCGHLRTCVGRGGILNLGFVCLLGLDSLHVYK